MDWRPEDGKPQDFLDVLYSDNEGDGEIEIESEDGENYDQDETWSSIAPTLSSFTHLLDFRQSPLSAYAAEGGRSIERSRSRSPISFNEQSPSGSGTTGPHDSSQTSRHYDRIPDAVIVADGQGRRIDNPEFPWLDNQDFAAEDEDYFLVPDAHTLYEVEVVLIALEDSTVGSEENEISNSVRARRGRGRVRGHASGRGRRRPIGQARDVRWKIGDPLTHVYLTDEDVPPELRDMVMEIMRKRQIKAQQERDRRKEKNLQEQGSQKDAEKQDVFEDAVDFGLTEDDLHFEWVPTGTFRGTEEHFRVQRTGSVKTHSTPYGAFRSYWDDEILHQIVNVTNWHATKITSPCFQAEWYPTNIHEVMCLFAFWIMLGVIRMPTIKSCFSRDPLLKTEIFRKIFTIKRYNNVVRALDFVDSDPYPEGNIDRSSSSDLLYRLRPIIEHMNTKFQENYIMSKDICIDESFTPCKGLLAKFGVKSFELCESITGYLWSFIFYKSLDANSLMLKSTSVVMRLMQPLLNMGYRLFVNNWYNSPLLARFLKRNGTDCVGTLLPSRQDVHPLINLAELEQGQFVARHSGDVCVLAWQDKKKVISISTCHGTELGLDRVLSVKPPRPLPFKPQVILDYNKYSGGVDLKDQILEPYLVERKRCRKWYMTIFKRLLNCSILNARILLESSLQKKQDNLDFRLRLVDGILTQHLSQCPQPRVHSAGGDMLLSESTRLHPGLHWPIRVEQTEKDLTNNRKSRKLCYLCNKQGRKYQKTHFKCEGCNVPLCVDGCFKTYHMD